MSSGIVIQSMNVVDVRFPTSLEAHGSDAMHTDPDYSSPYITLDTNQDGLKGYGFTFTLGRGTEIVVCAINSFKRLVVGRSLSEITDDFGTFYRSLTSETQMRWLGPEKGVMHFAAAAILNAIWDLWAKVEKKPVWKLLADMEPEKLVSCIDFRYIKDVLTPEDAIEILKTNRSTIPEREKEMKQNGFPAYTTSVGWLGYSDELIRKLCKEALAEGFTMFKMKVGANIEDDKRRAGIIREEIGWEKRLSMDANQRWEVNETIAYMKELEHYKPYWIEEPTSPDDVLGHATIARAINQSIGVATGEQCQNRIIFKQLLQAKAISFCQIDSCRVGSVNENLAIILMARKFGIPVCPHAGGVGLCELVQHLAFWNYICVAPTLKDTVCEFVDHLHEHFINPCVVKNGAYVLPSAPGYSAEMKAESVRDYEFENGPVWKNLRATGKVGDFKAV